MPRYGFNGQMTEMKIFILFILRYVLSPVTLEEMGEIVLIDDNMNYFLLSQSVSELVASDLLLREPGPRGSDVYSLLPRGRDTLEPVERTLPISLRQAGQEAARKVMGRLRCQGRTHTAIFVRDDEPMARLTLTDGKDILLRIELATGAWDRARQMCENFEKRAETIFDGVIRVLLDDG